MLPLSSSGSESHTQVFSSMSFQRVHIRLLISSPPTPPTLNPMTLLPSFCGVLWTKADPQITAEGRWPDKVTNSECSQVNLRASYSKPGFPPQLKMDFAELFIHSKSELCAYDVPGTNIQWWKRQSFYPHDTYFLVGKEENTMLNT